MGINAEIEIDIDDIAREVVESREFESAVEGIVDSKLDDAVDEKFDEKFRYLDVDDIESFQTRVEQIVSEVIEESAPSEAPVNDDLARRVAELERSVETISEALLAASILLRAAVGQEG